MYFLEVCRRPGSGAQRISLSLHYLDTPLALAETAANYRTHTASTPNVASPAGLPFYPGG